jgi:predicted GTPase
MGNAASREPTKKVEGLVLVLLGCTGDGKSTLGNFMLGLPNDSGFKASAAIHSCTSKTVHITGHWRGNPEEPVVTVVDTPGFSDSRGTDSKQRKEMVEYLKKEIGAAHVFLWVKRADARISGQELDSLKLFKSIFGHKEFTKRLIMVLTQLVQTTSVKHS